MNMHTHWRLLNRLMLGLLALILVTGTMSCLDTDYLSVFPEEVDEDDSGDDDTENPPGTGGGS